MPSNGNSGFGRWHGLGFHVHQQALDHDDPNTIDDLRQLEAGLLTCDSYIKTLSRISKM